MREHKLIFCAIGAFLAVVAAVTAVVIFKNEIIDFFAELKEKIENKRACCHNDFVDYADM